MAVITSKAELRDYILRRLGYPAVKINVTDEQVDDLIDDALQFYRTYHYNSREQVYAIYQVTATDIQNQYIPVDPLIVGIYEVKMASASNIGGFYNMGWMTIWNMIKARGKGVTGYLSVMQEIDTVRELFTKKVRWHFEKHLHKLTLAADWGNDIIEGDVIFYEAVKAIDPDQVPEVWNDMWLKEYATALVKRQWGQNLSKFKGVELPGGVTIDGTDFIQEAEETIRRLEDEVQNKWEMPPLIVLG